MEEGLSVAAWGQRAKGMRTYENDGYPHYFDCDSNFISIFLCLNLNFTL